MKVTIEDTARAVLASDGAPLPYTKRSMALLDDLLQLTMRRFGLVLMGKPDEALEFDLGAGYTLVVRMRDAAAAPEAMSPHDIKAALANKGVTQSAIASELGVLQPTVGKVIYGEQRSFRVATHIAKIIGKPASVIWPGYYARQGSGRRAAS